MCPPTAEIIAECKRKAMATMDAYRLRQAERKLQAERLEAWKVVTDTVPAISDEGRLSPFGEKFSWKLPKLTKQVQEQKLACFVE
jgi:hypothetical protein